jgi:hypothetical protein
VRPVRTRSGCQGEGKGKGGDEHHGENAVAAVAEMKVRIAEGADAADRARQVVVIHRVLLVSEELGMSARCGPPHNAEMDRTNAQPSTSNSAIKTSALLRFEPPVR